MLQRIAMCCVTIAIWGVTSLVLAQEVPAVKSYDEWIFHQELACRAALQDIWKQANESDRLNKILQEYVRKMKEHDDQRVGGLSPELNTQEDVRKMKEHDAVAKQNKETNDAPILDRH